MDVERKLPGLPLLDMAGIGRIQRQVHGQPVRVLGWFLATPADHVGPSYRNFFPTDARWSSSRACAWA